MKVTKDRKYTDAFRTNAVSQVLDGDRRQAAVAGSLEISVKTLANWVGKARDVKAYAPNRKWLTDITYVSSDEGWLYCAFVEELFSRKIVGWGMDEEMPQVLTQTAWHIALGLRAPGPGLVHHSDRASQYAANNYRAILAARGIVVSMSRRGDCWDNAPMESFNGTIKVECVYPTHFATRNQARQALVEYIGYYNTERMHSSLDYETPAAFERNWQIRQRKEACAAI